MTDRFELQLRKNDVQLLPIVGAGPVKLATRVGSNSIDYVALVTTESALVERWQRLLEHARCPYRCRALTDQGDFDISVYGRPLWK